MADEYPYCRKEKEIGIIQTKVMNIEKKLENVEIEIKGNNKPGLRETTIKLNDQVGNLNKVLPKLERGVDEFLQFQQNYLGIQEGKVQMKQRYEEELRKQQEVSDRRKKAIRWIISLAIPTILTLIGLVIAKV